MNHVAARTIPPKDRVMRNRVSCLAAIVLLNVLGTVGTAPAWARGGGGGGGHGSGGFGGHATGFARGSTVFNGSAAIRRSPLFRAPTAATSFAGRFGVWGDPLTPPLPGAFPMAPIVPHQINIANELARRGRGTFYNGYPVGGWGYWPYDNSFSSQAPAVPAVVVVTASPGAVPERSQPTPLPDYSYIQGCHAIPNGYHCDPPRKQAGSS
jgi:hypothetical protein